MIFSQVMTLTFIPPSTSTYDVFATRQEILRDTSMKTSTQMTCDYRVSSCKIWCMAPLFFEEANHVVTLAFDRYVDLLGTKRHAPWRCGYVVLTGLNICERFFQDIWFPYVMILDDLHSFTIPAIIFFGLTCKMRPKTIGQKQVKKNWCYLPKSVKTLENF